MTSLLTDAFMEKIASHLSSHVYDAMSPTLSNIQEKNKKKKEKDNVHKDLAIAENAGMGAFAGHASVEDIQHAIKSARNVKIIKPVAKSHVAQIILKRMPILAPVAGAIAGSDIVENLYSK